MSDSNKTRGCFRSWGRSKGDKVAAEIHKVSDNRHIETSLRRHLSVLSGKSTKESRPMSRKGPSADSGLAQQQPDEKRVQEVDKVAEGNELRPALLPPTTEQPKSSRNRSTRRRFRFGTRRKKDGKEAKASEKLGKKLKEWDAGIDLKGGSSLDLPSLVNAKATILSKETIHLLTSPAISRTRAGALAAAAAKRMSIQALGVIDWDHKAFFGGHMQDVLVRPKPEVDSAPKEASHAFFGTYDPTRTSDRRDQFVAHLGDAKQTCPEESAPPITSHSPTGCHSGKSQPASSQHLSTSPLQPQPTEDSVTALQSDRYSQLEKRHRGWVMRHVSGSSDYRSENFVARAQHWLNVYCKQPSSTEDSAEASLNEVDGSPLPSDQENKQSGLGHSVTHSDWSAQEMDLPTSACPQPRQRHDSARAIGTTNGEASGQRFQSGGEDAGERTGIIPRS